MGTLPSVFLIFKGLVIGHVDKPSYFAGKAIVYCMEIAILAGIAAKLFNSARGKK